MTSPADQPDPEFEADADDGYAFGQQMARGLMFKGGEIIFMHQGHRCGYAVGVREGFYEESKLELVDLVAIAVMELKFADCGCPL